MPWERGFNFRSTSTFVDDRPPETYSIGTAYPVTRNGVTFGWTATNSNTRDRTTTLDRRLAGIAFASNGGAGATFQVDLPSAGIYDLRLAIGDNGAGHAPQYAQVTDTDSGAVLYTLSLASGTLSNQVADAAGNVWLEKEWPGKNQPVRLALGRSIRVRIGSPAGSDNSSIEHLSLRRVESRHTPVRAAVVAAAGGGGSTPVSSSDTGTGTDAAALVAAVTGADTGAGAEGTPTVLAGLTQSDTGAGTDSGSLVAAASGSDTGTGADSQSVLAAVPGSDTGTGTDSSSLVAAASASDTGAGADASSLVVALTGSDTGSGSDAGSVFSGLSVSSSDSGAGSDASSLAAAPTSADTGSGSDSGSVVAALAGSETGTGTDAGASPGGGGTTPVTGSDTGSGSDSGSVVVTTPTPTPTPTPAAIAVLRDADVLEQIAALLLATNEFDCVVRALPDEVGLPTGATAAAVVQPNSFDQAETQHAMGFASSAPFDDSGVLTRHVLWTLTLIARDPDAGTRDRLADRLYCVAADAIDGQSLGGLTIPAWTKLLRGKYAKPAPPERQIVCTGEFSYLVAGYSGHATDA